MSEPDLRWLLLSKRAAVQFTTSEMAEYLHTPEETYVKWESGEEEPPGVLRLALQSAALFRGLRGLPKASQRPRHVGAIEDHPILGEVYKLATGEFSIPEIAAKTGIIQNTVTSRLHRLRALGYPAPVKDGRRQAERFPDLVARDQAVAAAIDNDYNYQEIAQEFGISRERVRQIANRVGMKGVRTHAMARLRMQREDDERARLKQERAEAISAGIDYVRRGFSIAKASRLAGVPANALGDACGEAGVESWCGRWKGKGLAARKKNSLKNSSDNPPDQSEEYPPDHPRRR